MSDAGKISFNTLGKKKENARKNLKIKNVYNFIYRPKRKFKRYKILCLLDELKILFDHIDVYENKL